MNIVNAIKASCSSNGTSFCSWNEIVNTLRVWGEQVEDWPLKMALSDLKKSGVITFPDRGPAARSRYSVVDPNFVPTPKIQQEQPRLQVAAQEVPALDRVQLVVLDADDAEVPANLYDQDEYLQRLAAEQTPCFGGWVPKAKACGSCPLASSCRLAAAAILHRMMVEAAAKPEAEAEQTVDTDADAEDDVQINLDAPEPARVERHTLVAVPISCFCSKCENLISQGTMAVVLDEGGVFHENCAP